VIRISQLRSYISAFFLAVVLLFGSLALERSTMAIAAPLTPEAAAYEIDQANSPEEANSRVQQKAQSYKKELREDTAYTKQAAKQATTKTKNALERAADNVRDKLNLDEPVPQSTKDFLNDIKP
jgi:membrane-bound lytic murein transglycosylase